MYSKAITDMLSCLLIGVFVVKSTGVGSSDGPMLGMELAPGNCDEWDSIG